MARKSKAERDAEKVHTIGQAICRAATDNCVMDDLDGREPCHTGNCRMMRIAEAALAQACEKD